jgi:hypothetical protein
MPKAKKSPKKAKKSDSKAVEAARRAYFEAKAVYHSKGRNLAKLTGRKPRKKSK